MLKFFKSKLKKAALSLKKFSIGKKIKELFLKKTDINFFEELERLFYEADLGVRLSLELTKKIKEMIQKHPKYKTEEIIKIIKDELISKIIQPQVIKKQKPHVIMIVGVNGSGKTTSIAKLAKFYQNQNKKVMLVAADTYRAAAIEQLTYWAEKIGCQIIKSAPKSDPSSVVFDALTAAKSREVDIVIIDTAGRLHTKTNLMQELEKIKRVTNKVIDNSLAETILVVDATTGQNAIDQAKIFNSYTPISSIFLTKLDGTAKGGIVLSIQNELKIPIKWVGVGEKLENLEIFDAEKFIEDLLALE